MLALVVVVDLVEAADELGDLVEAVHRHAHGGQHALAEAARAEHGPDPADQAASLERGQPVDDLVLGAAQLLGHGGEGALDQRQIALELVQQAALQGAQAELVG